MCGLKSLRQAKQCKHYIFSFGGQIDRLSCSCSHLCSWSVATDFRIMPSTVIYIHLYSISFPKVPSLSHLTLPAMLYHQQHHPYLTDKEIKT